jgi:hypothetical protein
MEDVLWKVDSYSAVQEICKPLGYTAHVLNILYLFYCTRVIMVYYLFCISVLYAFFSSLHSCLYFSESFFNWFVISTLQMYTTKCYNQNVFDHIIPKHTQLLSTSHQQCSYFLFYVFFLLLLMFSCGEYKCEPGCCVLSFVHMISYSVQPEMFQGTTGGTRSMVWKPLM